MSETRNADTLTRQPRSPSQGGPETLDKGEQISPEEALAQSQEALRAAEQERDAAHAREQSLARERDEARTREHAATGEAVSAQERSLLANIDHHKAAAESAKVAIANANAAGDNVAVAEAFDRLADSRAELRLLDQQKRYFDTEKERQKTQPPQQQGGHEISTPGGTQRVSPQVKEWADKHPRFLNDRDYYNHAVAAHQAVVGDGVNEGSPAYFRAIDEAMQKFEKFEAFERGELQPERQKPMNTQRPASSMGTPVSRGTESRGSRGEPSESQIARHLGVEVADLREYARVNGYKGAEGYKQYLADHQEIIDIEKGGGDTGLRVDGVYR